MKKNGDLILKKQKTYNGWSMDEMAGNGQRYEGGINVENVLSSREGKSEAERGQGFGSGRNLRAAKGTQWRTYMELTRTQWDGRGVKEEIQENRKEISDFDGNEEQMKGKLRYRGLASEKWAQVGFRCIIHKKNIGESSVVSEKMMIIQV